jgi:hypothetical protein
LLGRRAPSRCGHGVCTQLLRCPTPGRRSGSISIWVDSSVIRS